MYDPVGYYWDNNALCPDCAIVWANRYGLDLDDSELFAPISEFDETDSPVYCTECGDLIDTGLTPYGIASARERMLEAVCDGDLERARTHADVLREHFEPVHVYVYVSCSEGHEPAEISEPYATFHECAVDMLREYEVFPNIDRIDVEYDGDTIVSAAIDFLGGRFVQVQELCPDCGEPLDQYGYCETCWYLADDEPLDDVDCWLLTHPLALILDR